jgi:hypothetical protein
MKRRDAHIFEKAKDGFYVEPSWCSARLFEVEKFADTIYDPACGWGTILRSAQAAGYHNVTGGDVVDRRQYRFSFRRTDFLNGVDESWRSGVSVISNPPFDHVEEFCRKACRIANKVAMIMLTRRLNAAHWLGDLPLQKIYLMSPRPSMPPGAWIAAGNKPGGGTQDFCWLVFNRRHKGEPQLKWLYRDGK